MIQIEAKGKDIFLFGRENNNPTITKINNFYPYFYVEDNNGEYKSIDNKKLKKIKCNLPFDVRERRKHYNKHYEADIVYVNRFLIDNPDVIKKQTIRICYIDIEIRKPDEGYSSVFLANSEILTIGCKDSFSNEIIQFTLNKYTDEKEMLYDFIKFIRRTNPDMLIAWNGDGFDFPFLINRIRKKGINPDLLARSNNEYIGKSIVDKYETKIGGRILFDLMYAYRKWTSGEGRESFSLDYISKYENVGEKVKYKGELDKLYDENIEKFLEYNKVDVELLELLNEKLGLVEFFDELRIICCCTFRDVFMNSKMADSLCLKYAKENNFILPSTTDYKEESFEGGFVVKSIPGLHKKVACMDMKSLYPSIMIGFNTSYETMLDNKEENCINIDDKYFYRKELGIIPSIVKPLLEQRKVITKQMNNVLDKNSREYKTKWMTQYTLKTITNSFYGVLGFSKFRLYKREVAASITYTARKIISEVHKWFNDKGYEVIYGDTDSCFINMGHKTSNDFKLLNNEINDYFKTYFLQFGVEEKNNIFKLEFEKIYKTIFFKQGKEGGVKKRYAGRIMWDDGKEVDYFYRRGFESRRSDSPQVGRDFLDKLLKMICWEIEREEIEIYVKEFTNKIKEEYTPEQIAIPIGISKPLHKYGNQIQAKAARLANKKHNAGIQGGDKIKYLYVKNSDRVIGFKSDGYMWDGYQIDYNMMIRRIVDLKVGPIFDSLGWKHNYITKISKKKKKIILLKDVLKQNELW
jgi:DNA polymerase, archaea type